MKATQRSQGNSEAGHWPSPSFEALFLWLLGTPHSRCFRLRLSPRSLKSSDPSFKPAKPLMRAGATHLLVFSRNAYGECLAQLMIATPEPSEVPRATSYLRSKAAQRTKKRGQLQVLQPEAQDKIRLLKTTCGSESSKLSAWQSSLASMLNQSFSYPRLICRCNHVDICKRHGTQAI